MGQFEVNLQKLLYDPIPQLCVRYAHNKHAVPDIKQHTISHELTNMLAQLLDYHDEHKGEIHSEYLLSLPIQTLDPRESEMLLHVLHRSKCLSGGDVKARQKAITGRYDRDKNRLTMILAEIDAGNDNTAIKHEGRMLADLLKRVKRITVEQYRNTIQHLDDPH